MSASALRVERGGRFIENNDGRIAHESARDGDALALPAGEPHAAFAHARFVALRHLHDEIVATSRARGGFDFRLRRPGFGAADIPGDRLIEDHDFLADESDQIPQIAHARVAQIHSHRSRSRPPSDRKSAGAD